jgi:hypothetical protein
MIGPSISTEGMIVAEVLMSSSLSQNFTIKLLITNQIVNSKVCRDESDSNGLQKRCEVREDAKDM